MSKRLGDFSRRGRSYLLHLLRQRGIVVRRVNFQVMVPENRWLVQQWLLQQLGQSRPVIFDVGANVGQSIDHYRGLFPHCPIYSFEPFPDSFHILQRRFGHTPDIHLHELAISDHIGTDALHLTGTHTTHSLLTRTADERRYYPQMAKSIESSISVKTTTLDAFTAEMGINQIDILKMDIQGGELQALRGAEELLNQQKIGLLVLETAFIRHYEGEALFFEIAARLNDFDYTLYNIYDLFSAQNGQLRYVNALFVSRRLRQQVLDQFPDEP